MSTIPSWAVAAAILLRDGEAKSYKSLTSEVINTGLSDLGSRGETPWQTLRVDITKNHGDIFEGLGGRSGLYQVSDVRKALGRYDVRRALAYLFDTAIEQYQHSVRSILYNSIDLSKRDAAKVKQDISRLESAMHRLARLYTQEKAP
jgi:hypothetical protein